MIKGRAGANENGIMNTVV